jgi:hypothetical protein
MRKVLIMGLMLAAFAWAPAKAHAISDPTSIPNNRVGVHILDPNEIDRVADLVNSQGGDWGYVTVPLRADDRDRVKWQSFFAKAQEKHLIPIVRLATVMTPSGWAKPTLYDAVDFANFLNDLKWPTKNRYIVVYNEPNHATEWGGQVDPADYARILRYTSQIFKERSEDFFILPAGLDAAAPNDQSHMSLDRFIWSMQASDPEALAAIDGWSSHSYPNPAFSGKPTDTHQQSIAGFVRELPLVEPLARKTLPVFITETGWSNRAISDETLGIYYETAFRTVWQDSRVVAVTPFILLAGDGPFVPFSLLDPGGSPKPEYRAIQALQKVSGSPEKSSELVAQVLGETASPSSPTEPTPQPFTPAWGSANWKNFFNWLVPLEE